MLVPVRFDSGSQGVTVRVAVLLVCPCVAVNVTEMLLVTLLCFTVKFTLDCPAATVMVAGAVAAVGAELPRVILKPPVGAGPVSFTVPVTTFVDLP